VAASTAAAAAAAEHAGVVAVRRSRPEAGGGGSSKQRSALWSGHPAGAGGGRGRGGRLYAGGYSKATKSCSSSCCNSSTLRWERQPTQEAAAVEGLQQAQAVQQPQGKVLIVFHQAMNLQHCAHVSLLQPLQCGGKCGPLSRTHHVMVTMPQATSSIYSSLSCGGSVMWLVTVHRMCLQPCLLIADLVQSFQWDAFYASQL